MYLIKITARSRFTRLRIIRQFIDSLSANPTKWSNTLKQFVGNLSMFDHFAVLALKGLNVEIENMLQRFSSVSFSFKSPSSEKDNITNVALNPQS